MGLPVAVEADVAVTVDGCDHGVGDDLSGDEVEVGGVGSPRRTRVHGEESAFIADLGIDRGDVQNNRVDSRRRQTALAVHVEDHGVGGSGAVTDLAGGTRVDDPRRRQRHETTTQGRHRLRGRRRRRLPRVETRGHRERVTDSRGQIGNGATRRRKGDDARLGGIVHGSHDVGGRTSVSSRRHQR